MRSWRCGRRNLPLRIPRDAEIAADRAPQADPLLGVLAVGSACRWLASSGPDRDPGARRCRSRHQDSLGVSLQPWEEGGDVAAGQGKIFVSAKDRIIITDTQDSVTDTISNLPA